MFAVFIEGMVASGFALGSGSRMAMPATVYPRVPGQFV